MDDDFGDDDSGLDWTGFGNSLLGDASALAGVATTAGGKSITSAITGQPLTGNNSIMLLLLVVLVIFLVKK